MEKIFKEIINFSRLFISYITPVIKLDVVMKRASLIYDNPSNQRIVTS